MTANSDQMLTEILTTLRGLQGSVSSMESRLSVVETNVSTLLNDTRADLADHEQRLRAIESQRGAVLTRDEFDAIEESKATTLADAQTALDRKANIRLAIILLFVTAVNVGIDAFSQLH